MGISVPIGTDYYKILKKISDEHGLGLKRTLEFLVTYYTEKEKGAKGSPEKKTRKSPEKKRQKESRDTQKEKVLQTSAFQQSSAPEVNVEQERFYSETLSNAPEIEANDMSSMDTLESTTNNEHLFSPLASESESPAAEQQNFITPDNFFKQVSRSVSQCCYSCGFPKKPNAKFCTNCGILLKNTDENQDAYTIP
jgi:hypothetical protein